ncbi:UDP-2,3-diacylglucosamine pyrophosphatase [alpha proteobacterium U9-1i]|nr:UDP-2,3-diacylglucosamine pyrophosphatase [alpha proteobacterium U9-1i]
MPAWRKLGIIAGAGELPVALAEHCAAEGASYFVARVAPFADEALETHPHDTHGLGEMGARIAAMKAAGCDAVVFVGKIPRTDLRTLNWDAGGMAMVPALAAAAPKGDDALLRAVLDEHAKQGFVIIGADQVMEGLAAPDGVWGKHAPSAGDLADMRLAARVAAAMGTFDVGQGVVACAGLILAVEAQEQTDAMLQRVATLPTDIRGGASARRGVLVKRPKPIQERRIDLPVIGVRTIEGAAAAGLAGVAVEAGGALAVRRAAIIAAADAAGLFVFGFTSADLDVT